MIVESIPQDRPSSQSRKEAWVEFIKRYEPFAWYATLTFKEPKHPESADKAFFRWIRHINECLYGRRFREKKKGVTYFKCMEYQKRDVMGSLYAVKGEKIIFICCNNQMSLRSDNS